LDGGEGVKGEGSKMRTCFVTKTTPRFQKQIERAEERQQERKNEPDMYFNGQ